MKLVDQLAKIKAIQSSLLLYLKDESIDEDNDFNSLMEELNKEKDLHTFKSILILVSKIFKNHHHNNDFITKIKKFLLNFKEKMFQYFSNIEIFNIFKSNKQILLFLFEEQIIEIDEYIVNKMLSDKYLNDKYSEYFSLEIKQFLDKECISDYEKYNWFNDFVKNLPENFEEKRITGENDSYICELIRKDSVIEFIVYMNKTDLPINSFIQSSIYETNQYLLKNVKTTIIEYAGFFGSIQIFRYLLTNGADLSPDLWFYVIHGRNPELIHLLEENEVEPKDKSYLECFKESIKCHHNEIANYINDNYINTTQSNDIFIHCIKYHNFEFIDINLIDKSSFYNLCKYNHYLIIDSLMKEIFIDVNQRTLSIGKTGFYLAVEKENIEIIKLILTNSRLCINTLNNDGDNKQTAFYKAVENQNIDIIQLLLTHPKIDINIPCQGKEIVFIKSPLYLAIEKGNFDIIKLIFQSNKLDINFVNKISIKKWEDVQYYEKTAFFLAVENLYKFIDIIKLFLTNEKLDPNIICKESYFRYRISERGTYLIYEKSVLYHAFENDNIEIIKLLLTNENLNINILNKGYKRVNAETALFLAVEKKNYEIINLFLANNKCNINTPNENGISPFYYAVSMGYIDIIKMFLGNQNLDINLLNKVPISYKDNGCFIKGIGEKTALYCAVENQNIRIIKLILMNPKLKINILNKVSSIKETALHHAVAIENIKIIKLLLGHKDINVNQQDENGKKPIDYCKNEKIKRIFHL